MQARRMADRLVGFLWGVAIAGALVLGSVIGAMYIARHASALEKIGGFGP